MALTAGEKTLRAKLAAHAQHAQHDSRKTTAAARKASPGSDSYWELQVDPEGLLAPQERVRRAGHAKKAHFYRLGLASARARRKAAGK
jgi:hypothetical protein